MNGRYWRATAGAGAGLLVAAGLSAVLGAAGQFPSRPVFVGVAVVAAAAGGVTCALLSPDVERLAFRVAAWLWLARLPVIRDRDRQPQRHKENAR